MAKQEPAAPAVITISGVPATAEDFYAFLYERICDNWDLVTRMQSLIDQRVRETLGKAIDDEVKRQVREVVAASIAEGWADYSSYGAAGPKKSLAERVNDLLSKKVGNYNSNTTVLETIFAEQVNAAMREELGEELKVIRARFAEQVDTVLQSKLVETLRAALGLKA